MNAEAVVKAIFAAIIGGAVIVASFYFAYLLLLVAVVGGIGGIAYLYFNRRQIFHDPDNWD